MICAAAQPWARTCAPPCYFTRKQTAQSREIGRGSGNAKSNHGPNSIGEGHYWQARGVDILNTDNDLENVGVLVPWEETDAIALPEDDQIKAIRKSARRAAGEAPQTPQQRRLVWLQRGPRAQYGTPVKAAPRRNYPGTPKAHCKDTTAMP